jgi:hypothetical protein
MPILITGLALPIRKDKMKDKRIKLDFDNAFVILVKTNGKFYSYFESIKSKWSFTIEMTEEELDKYIEGLKRLRGDN